MSYAQRTRKGEFPNDVTVFPPIGYPETLHPPPGHSQDDIVAPKAQFQLVAGCDVADFGCPLTMCVCRWGYCRCWYSIIPEPTR